MLMMCPLWQDVTDLFGTDLPVEGGKGGEFAWRDGPLLAALKAGHWVVLDEVRTTFDTIFYGMEPSDTTFDIKLIVPHSAS